MDMQPAVWSLVVPVKAVQTAKSRLSLPPDVRRDLALAFAVDTVTAALASPYVGRVTVVTRDPAVTAAVTAAGAGTVGEPAPAGLNQAVLYGARAVGPDGPVAALCADLPCLRSGDLDAALGLAAHAPRSFVPDGSGTGTVLLAATTVPLEPCFGPGSAAAHHQGGATPVVPPGAPGLRHDVDTVEDLAWAVRLGVGTATAAALARHAAGLSAFAVGLPESQ